MWVRLAPSCADHTVASGPAIVNDSTISSAMVDEPVRLPRWPMLALEASRVRVCFYDCPAVGAAPSDAYASLSLRGVAGVACCHRRVDWLRSAAYDLLGRMWFVCVATGV